MANITGEAAVVDGLGGVFELVLDAEVVELLFFWFILGKTGKKRWIVVANRRCDCSRR
jgi:hypothetical protein